MHIIKNKTSLFENGNAEQKKSSLPHVLPMHSYYRLLVEFQTRYCYTFTKYKHYYHSLNRYDVRDCFDSESMKWTKRKCIYNNIGVRIQNKIAGLKNMFSMCIKNYYL